MKRNCEPGRPNDSRLAGVRAMAASAAFLLVHPGHPAAARGEAATNSVRMPTAVSESAVAPTRRFPPGCAVAVAGGPNGARWFLPRATLVVENRSSHRFTLRMEARAGIETAGSDLGFVESGESRTFPHVVPAGRTTVLAGRDGGGITLRQSVYIWNHGPFTCRRKFVWILR